MKVKCLNCGLVHEKEAWWKGGCPRCGFNRYCIEIKKKEEKVDKESLTTMSDLAKEFLRVVKKEGLKIVKKEGKSDETMMELTMKARDKREREKGLAFVIFDIKDQKKVNVRKIYLNGHIEGFEGSPVIVNHIFSKMQALKYLAQSINEEYRNILRKCLLSDFYPMKTIDILYQKWKETIEKI